jgi:hypothetical protein
MVLALEDSIPFRDNEVNKRLAVKPYHALVAVAALFALVAGATLIAARPEVIPQNEFSFARFLLDQPNSESESSESAGAKFV